MYRPVAQRAKFTEFISDVGKQNAPCNQHIDRQLPIIKRGLAIDALVFWRRPKILTQIQTQMIEDAFTQRTRSCHCRIVSACHECYAHLLKQSIMVGNDRERLRPHINKILNLRVEIPFTELLSQAIDRALMVLLPKRLYLVIPMRLNLCGDSVCPEVEIHTENAMSSLAAIDKGRQFFGGDQASLQLIDRRGNWPLSGAPWFTSSTKVRRWQLTLSSETDICNKKAQLFQRPARVSYILNCETTRGLPGEITNGDITFERML